ncbi:MAG TPA: hypothetical protein VGC73_15335 [Pyrinomonadaceae bacterium]|jgi:hypothetical protein
MKGCIMLTRGYQALIVLTLFLVLTSPASAQKSCYTAAAREDAMRTAKVFEAPDPGYDPVLGYNPATTQRAGALKVGADGRALPLICSANKKPNEGSGTTPKFYCSVPGVVEEDGELVRYKIKPHFKGQTKEKMNGEIYGEFLSSRFSKALGFFADEEWVADVTCPDCEKSLNKSFQGASFSPFQPAAGVELSLGDGIDVKCDRKDTLPIAGTLATLLQNGAPRAEIDAFKLWLAFIDHGDTKTDNQTISCLDSKKNGDGTKICKPGKAVFYVSDAGSTFGYNSASEKKARLATWKGKDPIKVSGGSCSTTAKSVGDASISEAGRQLLADGLQKLLDAETTNGTITKVFSASRNEERDQPPAAWTAEFVRKAKTIIDARCTN